MMDKLIFDRLFSDVDNALNNPNSPDFLKGAYNYTDLNRVESWCEYIENIFNEYGFNSNLNFKKNWNIKDYPTRTQIDRIRHNVETLKDYCYAIKSQDEITYDNTLTYKQANILEKILNDIDSYIIENTREVYLNENMGIAIVRTNYCNFLLDTHKRQYECKTGMRIAGLLNTVKYIELKGEC